jgi:hypothetical protein
MKIPTFRELLYSLASKGSDEVMMKASHSIVGGETRITVPIRAQTRLFYEAQAKHFNTSVAALTGATLDTVAAQELESRGSTHDLITSRFYLILREHDLSLPAAAEIFRDLKITAGDMSVPSLLLERLTVDNLDWIASHFHVNYDWLSGKSELMSGYSTQWYKQPVSAAKRLIELGRTHTSVNVNIVRVAGYDYNSDESKNDADFGTSKRSTSFRPIISIERNAGPRETYRTYEAWEDGRWSYERCRENIKMLIFFGGKIREELGLRINVSGITVDADRFSSNVLSATLFKSHPTFDWHPDDFVEPTSAVAKDSKEWLRIRSSKAYATDFDAFQELLKQA